MLKLLITAAPYLLKARGQNSQKQIARSFTALVLFALSGLALIIAAFIYVTSIYGAAIGFIAISAIFMVGGSILYFKARTPKQLSNDNLPSASTNDPIATLIPEAIMKDPAVSKLMGQVTANPIATSLAAATIGIIVTREIMKD